MKQKKYIEHLRRTLPEEEEIECQNCKQKFCDQFNLLSLSALNFCLLFANKKLDKDEIERRYNVT